MKTLLALLLMSTSAMACETTVHPHLNSGEKMVGVKIEIAPIQGISGVPNGWSLMVNTQHDKSTIEIIANVGAAFATSLNMTITTNDCSDLAGVMAILPLNQDPTPDNVTFRAFTSDDYTIDK